MLDIKHIRENPGWLDKALARRNQPAQEAQLTERDKERRAIQTQLQELQAKRNDISKKIGDIKKAKGDADALTQEVNALKEQMTALEEKDKQAAVKVEELLATIPNVPADDVPLGKDEKDNKEIRKVGEPSRKNNAKEHFDIGEKLGLMDFETAAKLSGARFTLLKGRLAQLERALGNFMLDTHTKEFGYTEMSPPLIVKEEIMFGTAQLPKFKADQFATVNVIGDIDYKKANTIPDGTMAFNFSMFTEEDTAVFQQAQKQQAEFKLVYRQGKNGIEPKCWRFEIHRWLIPTAEVPLTNVVYDSIVEEAELPLRMVAKTACFRAEAGAAGKDTRGMLRQHQFYKVELVSITAPDKSNEEHERMTNAAETILKKLELPFRTVLLCSGDMGFASRKTYDIEVWLPGQNAYREISSCSNCGDFQARRMKARFRKPGDKATHFVHTLNGSGVAVGRCLIAILENYVQDDGSVVIPPALRPYMGGADKIAA